MFPVDSLPLGGDHVISQVVHVVRLDLTREVLLSVLSAEAASEVEKEGILGELSS